MSDFKTRKKNPHGMYPTNREVKPEKADVMGSGFTRVEPWITPERLKNEYLFGIRLISPTTKEELSNDTIKNIIARAAARVELECNIDVFPVTRVIRQPWDRVKFQQGYGQLELGVRQINTLLEVSIRTVSSMHVSNDVAYNDTDESREGVKIFEVPLSWVDPSMLRKGILHLMPLLSTPGSMITGVSPFGSVTNPLLQLARYTSNIPSYFFIRYTSGFEENSIPSIVNDLIATYACIDILSLLGPTNRFNSQSISIDGASQGLSGPGNQLYTIRINDLQMKADRLKSIITARFTNRIFMRHI